MLNSVDECAVAAEVLNFAMTAGAVASHLQLI